MSSQRVVVDSSGWIEVFTNGRQAETFLALMADERSLVVPAITIFEVFKWVLREHGKAQAIQAAAAMECGQVVARKLLQLQKLLRQLDPGHLLQAGQVVAEGRRLIGQHNQPLEQNLHALLGKKPSRRMARASSSGGIEWHPFAVDVA